MDKLTEAQKNVLREMVRLVRSDTVEEEFTITWQGALVMRGGKQVKLQGPTFNGKDGWGGFDPSLNVSNLVCELLSEEGFIRFREIGHGDIQCSVTPAGFAAVDSNFVASHEDLIMRRPPIEITESLARFRKDYPDPRRLAFVMMRFAKSTAHTGILTGIRNALDPHSLVALRADDKVYHDDLFFNILTYVYGCQFGIAVFERIEDEIINPNVSLEVGYMLGLGKSVCFLKDRTQKTLQTDLIGKLYCNFDSFTPETTIPEALFKWMEDRGFMALRR